MEEPKYYFLIKFSAVNKPRGIDGEIQEYDLEFETLAYCNLMLEAIMLVTNKYQLEYAEHNRLMPEDPYFFNEIIYIRKLKNSDIIQSLEKRTGK